MHNIKTFITAECYIHLSTYLFIYLLSRHRLFILTAWATTQLTLIKTMPHLKQRFL